MPGKNYQDFEISIERCVDQAYPVRVRSQKGEGHGQFIMPYPINELERRLGLIERSLLSSLANLRRVPSTDEKLVQEFGQVLFDGLFDGEVRDLYYSSLRDLEPNSGLRVRLVIQDPRLAALPWEFLYDPRQHSHICLSANTPLVRGIDLPRPLRPMEVDFPLRVLGLVASPRDLDPLNVEAEKSNVNEALKQLAADQRVEVEWLQGSTWRDLQQAMWRGPWHIFHFIGHGGYHTERDEGYICLTDQDKLSKNLYASELAMLLGDHPSLRLAVLNACSSAHSAGGDMFSSAASTLMHAGIPAVLAMQYAISDDAALELARSFYAALVNENPLELAVAEARKAIRLSGKSLEWAAPVLYSRAADGVLFHGRPQAAQAAEKPKTSLGHVEKTPGEKSPGEKSPGEKSPREKTPEPVQNAAPAAASKNQPAPYMENDDGATRGIRVFLNRDVSLDLVYVPVGEFIMGLDQAGEDLGPAHSLAMYGYWISRYPVTYPQFMDYARLNPAFDKDQPFAHELKAAYPVVGVTYANVLGFCAWLNKAFHNVLPDGLQFALPTEAEWEKAARGTDRRLYPWGMLENLALANVLEASGKGTVPVDANPPKAQSPYGCADLCGNVWEMTRSIYSRQMPLKLFSLKYLYPFQHTDGRNDSQKPNVLRVARGGSYRTSIKKCRVVDRACFDDKETRPDLGFRIVLTPLNPTGRVIAPAEQINQLEILLGLLDDK